MTSNRTRTSGDVRANESKRVPYRGPRPTDVDRSWFCRSCGCEEIDTHIPAGWFRLERKLISGHGGPGSQPYLRLGVFCSAECVAAQLPRLVGVTTKSDRGEIGPARQVREHLCG